MTPTTPTTFADLVNYIIDFIDILIPALFGVLFLYLIWKMFDSWVINAGEETKREEGKKYATAAVIVFVLMISAWGIVIMIQQTFLR
ncbi:hypothetical protein H6784_05275 [Candidatus Nomurabacteria bacterium]|nr:hypothetical protein [Candidatus Kaiserbacteria bacterium]MCB9814791.1 hypothetical protein [Candidatus Nomurabacteria bacterium]